MEADAAPVADVQPKAKIFISYSRKDMAFADRLEAALKTRGFEPLIDRTEIYAFEDWWKRLQALIAQADTVVFMLSPDAVASREALREVEYAESLNKRFAPIVCRKVDDAEVPEALRRLNFVFFDDPARFELSADQLTEALRTDIGWIRQHTEFAEIAHRWSATGRPGGLLLRSPSLEEAERWIASRPSGAPAPTEETQAFVAGSRRGATRRRNILTGSLAAGLLAALALAGLAYWQRGIAVEQQRAANEQRQIAVQQRQEAEQEKQRADHNFAAAKQTVDSLIFDIAQGLNGVVGMRVDTIHKILDTVQKTIDQLVQTSSDDPQLLRLRAVMFGNFVDTYLKAGDLKDAGAAVAQGVDIFRKLAALNPSDANAQRDLGLALKRLGDVKLAGGDLPGALAAYQESLDIGRKLAAQDPSNVQRQSDVAVSLGIIGDAKRREGDLPGTLAAYQESLDIFRKLAVQDPSNAQAQRYVSDCIERIGDVKRDAGDLPGALAAYQESLDVARKLATQDPSNADAQRDVSLDLTKAGDAKLDEGDLPGALAAFQESVDIFRKLAAQDQGNAEVQRNLSVGLSGIGDVKLKKGDLPGALVAYQEALDIARKLAAQDPSNAGAQYDVSFDLNKIGDVKLKENDRSAALSAYQESLVITRKLAALDVGDAGAQTHLVVGLYKTNKLLGPTQARAVLTEALSIVEKLDQEHKLTAGQKGWPDIIRTALAKLG